MREYPSLSLSSIIHGKPLSPTTSRSMPRIPPSQPRTTYRIMDILNSDKVSPDVPDNVAPGLDGRDTTLLRPSRKRERYLRSFRDGVHDPFDIAQPRQVSRVARRSSHEEHFVVMHLDVTTVMAFPDSCSSINIVSEQFLNNSDISFDSQFQHTYKLPDGKEVYSVGVVELGFRLEGDDSLHQQAFSVLRNCIHNVILGYSFLERIQLFTKFVHRLKWIPRALSVRMPHVCLVESPQQAITGSINGSCVSAAPDTGSDVNLISRALAESLGFLIVTDSHRVITLEFINGSTTCTYGLIQDAEWRFSEHAESTRISSRQPSNTLPPTVVQDWKFGDDATPTDVFVCDFYVLDNLTPSVILSSDLLLGSNAFKACASNFRPAARSTKRQREARELDICLIRKKNKRGVARGNQGMLKPALPDASSTPTIPLTPSQRFDHELQRRGEEADHIAELTPAERAAAQATEVERQQEWDASQHSHAGKFQHVSQPTAVQHASTQASSLPQSQSPSHAQGSNTGP